MFSMDSTILYLSEIKSDDIYLKKYQVQLIDYHWRLENMEDAMGINVVSSKTKQEIRVMFIIFMFKVVQDVFSVFYCFAKSISVLVNRKLRISALVHIRTLQLPILSSTTFRNLKLCLKFYNFFIFNPIFRIFFLVRRFIYWHCFLSLIFFAWVML